MHLVDNGSQAASPPALPAAVGTPGYFTDGVPGVTPPTRVNAAQMNAWLVELTSAITQCGETLDRTDNAQLATILVRHIRSLIGNATDTTFVTTPHLRSVMASSTSKASGAQSAVVASNRASATGASSVAIATDGTEAITAGVSGDNSAWIASQKTNAGVNVGIAGDMSAAVASEDCDIDATAATTLIAAADTCRANTSGVASIILAALECVLTGTGARKSIISSSGCDINGGGNVALLGSANARVGARTNGVALGWHASALGAGTADANLTMWLNAENGSGNATAWNTSGADFAEWFRCREPLPAGTPVTLDGDVVVECADDDWLLGVVSDNAGIVGNQAGLDPRGDGWVIVGLLGQIRVIGDRPVNSMAFGGRVRVMAPAGADGRQLCFVR